MSLVLVSVQQRITGWSRTAPANVIRVADYQLGLIDAETGDPSQATMVTHRSTPMSSALAPRNSRTAKPTQNRHDRTRVARFEFGLDNLLRGITATLAAATEKPLSQGSVSK